MSTADSCRSGDGGDTLYRAEAMAMMGVRRGDYRLTFVALVLGVSSYTLLQSLVTPALPEIQRDLHTTQTAVTWVVTGYLLVASVCTPILGRIGDMVGKERMMVVTLAALAAGTALAAVAHSIGLLIAARLIQGLGGGTLPIAFGIVRDEFPRDKVAGGIGFIAAMIAVGSGAGIVLAGPIVQHLDYHWLFWIPLGLIAAGAVAVHLVVPPSPVRSGGGVNWLGGVLLSGWLVALLVGVSQGPSWGWASGRVLGLFIGAAVLIAVWVLSEWRSAAPLVDMRMMRAPAVWTTNLTALLFGVGMYAPMAFLPAFVQTRRSAGYGFGASVLEAGLFMLPSTGTMFVMGLVSGRLANWLGSKIPTVVGAAISTGAFAGLAVAHHEVWQVMLSISLMGLGMGMAFAAMTNLIVDAVPPEQTGVASGMNANIRTIGGSIGAQVAASIVTSGVALGTLPREAGYSHAFAFLAVMSGAAALTALVIPTPQRSGTPHIDHAELALVAAGPITEGEPA